MFPGAMLAEQRFSTGGGDAPQPLGTLGKVWRHLLVTAEVGGAAAVSSGGAGETANHLAMSYPPPPPPKGPPGKREGYPLSPRGGETEGGAGDVRRSRSPAGGGRAEFPAPSQGPPPPPPAKGHPVQSVGSPEALRGTEMQDGESYVSREACSWVGGGWVGEVLGGWVDRWVGGWMDGWTNGGRGWMDGWLDGWVGGWMDGWTNGGAGPDGSLAGPMDKTVP